MSSGEITAEQRERQRRNLQQALERRRLKQQQQMQMQPATSGSHPVVSMTSSQPVLKPTPHQPPPPRPQKSIAGYVTTTTTTTTPAEHNPGAPSSSSSGPTLEVTCSLLSGQRFQVESRYDKDLTQFVRNIPSRDYNSANRTNNFELRHYNMFVSSLKEAFGERLRLTELPAWIKSVFHKPLSGRPLDATTLPALDLSSRLPELILSRLHPYQTEAVKFAVSNQGRCLIADDMGLGKTVMALAVADYYRQSWPLLIVCPSSVKETWSRKIVEWCPAVRAENVRVVNKQADAANLPDVQLAALICTYDILTNTKLAVVNYKCGIVILDESHSIKDFKAQRTKTCEEVCKKAKHILLLSGTPALSKPAELYTQISILKPSWIRSMNYKQFAIRYCDGRDGRFAFEAKGATNTDELRALLQQTVMIRRTKDQVAVQLLPKIRHLRVIQSEAIKQKYKAAIEAANLTSLAAKPLSNCDADILQLYEKTCVAKADTMAEHAVAFIKEQPDAKTLIFAHHSYMLDVIDQQLTINRLRHVRIDGQTSSVQRQVRVDEFQDSPACRVALLSVTAANTGITMHAANTVMFAELHWTPATLTQAEDRAHRVGQTQQVHVYYLVARGTVDDRIWEMINGKLNVLQSVSLAAESLRGAHTHHVGETDKEREQAALHNAAYTLDAYLDRSGGSASTAKSQDNTLTAADEDPTTAPNNDNDDNDELAPDVLAQLLEDGAFDNGQQQDDGDETPSRAKRVRVDDDAS